MTIAAKAPRLADKLRHLIDDKDLTNIELIASWSLAGFWTTTADSVEGKPRFASFHRGNYHLRFDLHAYKEVGVLELFDRNVESGPPAYLEGVEEPFLESIDQIFKDALGLVFAKLRKFKNDYVYSSSFKGEGFFVDPAKPQSLLGEARKVYEVYNFLPYGADEKQKAKSNASKKPYIVEVPTSEADKKSVSIDGAGVSSIRFAEFETRAFIIFHRFGTDSTISFAYTDKATAILTFEALTKEMSQHLIGGGGYRLADNLED